MITPELLRETALSGASVVPDPITRDVLTNIADGLLPGKTGGIGGAEINFQYDQARLRTTLGFLGIRPEDKGSQDWRGVQLLESHTPFDGGMGFNSILAEVTGSDPLLTMRAPILAAYDFSRNAEYGVTAERQGSYSRAATVQYILTPAGSVEDGALSVQVESRTPVRDNLGVVSDFAVTAFTQGAPKEGLIPMNSIEKARKALPYLANLALEGQRFSLKVGILRRGGSFLGRAWVAVANESVATVTTDRVRKQKRR